MRRLGEIFAGPCIDLTSYLGRIIAGRPFRKEGTRLKEKETQLLKTDIDRGNDSPLLTLAPIYLHAPSSQVRPRGRTHAHARAAFFSCSSRCHPLINCFHYPYPPLLQCVPVARSHLHSINIALLHRILKISLPGFIFV